MEDLLHNTLLFDFYGKLLTGRQRDIYHLYYCEDLTLAEVGEKLGITRQAVNLSLKQAQGNLLNFEENLMLVARHVKAQGLLAALKSAIGAENRMDTDNILQQLDDIF